jgi:SAM-dependent methyltransferase
MSVSHQLFDRRLQRRWFVRHAGTIAAGDFLRRQVAEDIADRLGVVTRRFEHGLVLGAGASAAASVLTATGKIAGLVIGEPVLELLRDRRAGGLVLDSESLPFADGNFDLIVSLLDLHGVNDLPGTLVQLRRLLRPDGLLVATLIGGTSLNELSYAFASAESELKGGASPRVAPMIDIRDLGHLLQRAGFALPVTDLDRLSLNYASPLALMRELRSLGLGNALVARSRHPLGRSVLRRAIETYARGATAGDGRVAATIEILTATAWSPDPSQQQPLKPGSARAKLADALGAVEQTVGGPISKDVQRPK